MMKKLLFTLMSGAAAMLLPSCNGILEDIYDEPESEVKAEYGFIESCRSGNPGTIYINASDYTRWTYIDFSTMQIDTLSVDDDEPAEWDIAIHRYDVKTNNAQVAETGETELSSSISGYDTAALTFIADEWTTTKIVTDMSTMMDGYLSYAESFYNRELSRWLDVDTSTMPPIYTPSDKVYIIRLSGGDRAAVRLQNYMSPSGIKGYMTIQYVYPL